MVMSAEETELVCGLLQKAEDQMRELVRGLAESHAVQLAMFAEVSALRTVLTRHGIVPDAEIRVELAKHMAGLDQRDAKFREALEIVLQGELPACTGGAQTPPGDGSIEPTNDAS